MSGCLLAFSLGCAGPDRPTCYPVEGQVEWKGQPVSEAMIVFHPLAELTPPAPKPIAQTDAAGRFRLTTFVDGDGAPAGEYDITVVLRDQRLVGEELVRDGKNLLPTRYSRPGTAGFRYRVVEGSNQVPTLHLQPR